MKVSQVREEGGAPPKINCSMKVVSQEDGADLDPGNTRGAQGGRPGFQGPVTDAAPEASTPDPWQSTPVSWPDDQWSCPKEY